MNRKDYHVEYVTGGCDSDIFIVKLDSSKERTQLVKLYVGLGSRLQDKKHLIAVLKNYFETFNDVRSFLSQNNNPLEQKINIEGHEFDLEFTAASSGTLIEKNDMVGSWVRNWIPGRHMTDSRVPHQIYTHIRMTNDYLSEKFKIDMNPSEINYKVIVDEKNEKVRVIFTDICNSILQFVTANETKNS